MDLLTFPWRVLFEEKNENFEVKCKCFNKSCLARPTLIPLKFFFDLFRV